MQQRIGAAVRAIAFDRRIASLRAIGLATTGWRRADRAERVLRDERDRRLHGRPARTERRQGDRQAVRHQITKAIAGEMHVAAG